MDPLSQWHRAMTTIVLFGTSDMPISSITLADAFRIIDADEFVRRMSYTTQSCRWNSDIFAIKADAIYTLEGVPQSIPIPMPTGPRHPGIPPHQTWYQAFLRELFAIWKQTPSVIVIRMILPITLSSQANLAPVTPEPTPPAIVLPSSPSSLLEDRYAFFDGLSPPPDPSRFA